MPISTALSAAAVAPLILGWLTTVLTGGTRRIGHCGILYHSITSERPRNLSQVPAKRFSLFLERLQAHGVRTCSVREWLENLLEGNKSATTVRLLPLAFDDGFADVYENAFPVLQELGMSATLYPVAGYMGRFSDWDPVARLHHLSNHQLREISQAGIEIGSHTLTHPDLRRLSARAVRKELLESKKILEDICSVPITSISFPYGSWNTKLWLSAQELGFSSAAVYGGSAALPAPLLPLTGMYAFDTVDDMFEKADSTRRFSIARARAFIMPHFAKGAPLWRFRREYQV